MRYLIVLLILFMTSSAFAGQQSAIYFLSDADVDSLSDGFQYALNKSPNHQVVDWINPVTGLSGSTVPTRSYKLINGQVCREFLSALQLDGTIRQAFGTACLQADGGWKITEVKPVKRDRQALHFVYVKQSSPQGQQGNSFAYSHPAVKRSQIRSQNFHTDLFYEKIRTLQRCGQPAAEPHRIEQRKPSKLLKLVAY